MTSGVGGHLADPVCHGGVTLEASSFARYAPWLVAVAHAADRPLIVDTGGLLSPGGVATFAARQDPASLAELVDRLGYRALAFGASDLSAPRRRMIAVARELRARGIPMVASNVVCTDAAGALCGAMVDTRDGVPIFRVGEERVAFLAVVGAQTLERVSPDRAAGLRVIPPKVFLPHAIRRARARGVTMVVVSVDHGQVDDAAAKALELARALPEDAKPDALLAAGAGRELLFARPVGYRPAIVAAPPAAALQLLVRRNVWTDTFEVMAQPLAPVRHPAEAVQRWIARVGGSYCAEWGRRLPGGSLDEPIAGDEMLRLAAGAMRQAQEAEVAIVNRGVLDSAWRPAQPGELTASDVFIALQYDEPLVVADVSGEWLARVARASAPAGLVIAGVTVDGDDVEVNGRPIETRGDYRVVTIRYLARGGDAALPEGPEWIPVPEETLRSAVLAHLEVPREVDPREALWDPAREPQWTFRAKLDATFSGSHVATPPDAMGVSLYTEPRLSRQPALSFGFESAFRADAVADLWGWDNEAIARYRTTRTGTSDYAEGADLLSLRSTLRWRYLRSRWDRVWVPDPYFETYLESELTENEQAGFHHMLLRPVAGVLFELTEHLVLKLRGGFQAQLLAPDAEVHPGLGAELTLDEWVLLESGERRLTTKLTLDYFALAGVASPIGDAVRGWSQQLRGSFDSAFTLAGPLSMSFSIQLYAQKDPGIELGLAMDAIAALRIDWLGRTVGP